DARRIYLHGDRLRLERVPVDPDRAHHLETLQLCVVEQHHPYLGVEVFAYRADQMGHDLGERLGSSQGGAHRVETFEIETLLLQLGLLAERGHGLLLELEAHQGRYGGDDENDHDGGDDIPDDVGL